MIKKFKLIGTILLVPIIFYMSCVHIVNAHEAVIGRNLITGQNFIDTVSGIKFSAPWTLVNNMDLRPMKVCVSSSASNFNCKLVSFNPKGWEKFIELEGFTYYWWANRLSYNIGHEQEYRGLIDILKGYSYDEKSREFITIEHTQKTQ